MATPIEHVQDLKQKIKHVLMQDWDPIGVQAMPEAEDEYDSYVPQIFSMLISCNSVDEMLEYLLWLEGEHMGLTVDRQRTRCIAEKLMSLDEPTTSPLKTLRDIFRSSNAPTIYSEWSDYGFPKPNPGKTLFEAAVSRSPTPNRKGQRNV